MYTLHRLPANKRGEKERERERTHAIDGNVDEEDNDDDDDDEGGGGGRVSIAIGRACSFRIAEDPREAGPADYTSPMR